ncbi:MAG: large conductance mechanosensitive channel protein MscL [Lachnospiraceae bacterium]|nr:large conductance mechanosensitive channel protein MscL [Lachnospiraceae bacterium]
MGLVKEFKEFMNRGNVVDMAVGVVIGAAFKAIIDSVVADLISPLIGIIFQQDFSSLKVTINGSDFTYGNLIMAIVNFVIVAFILFLFVKGVNKMRAAAEARKKKESEEAAAAPTTKICPYCKSEIPIDATKCSHCTSDVE